MLNQIPPQNINAEKSVLSAIIVNKDILLDIMPILKTDDFYKEEHRLIYDTMLDLFKNNEPIDIITIPNKLKQNDKFLKICSFDYINNLANITPTSANAIYHAKIIHDKAKLRNLIMASNSIIGEAFNENEEVNNILAFAEKEIYKATLEDKGNSFVSMKDIMLDSFKQIEQITQMKDGVTGLPTGFIDLDKMTSGLQPSDLILIAARPSMGKTAFVLNIAENVAIRGKKPVAFFSLEMSKKQLGIRMLLSESCISSNSLKSNNMTDKDWDKLIGAGEIIAKSPIYIDDTAGISISELASKARKLKIENGLSLIVIDYLQLMQSDSSSHSSDNRQQEISDISRSLKKIARELDVPVIALSQLSRSVESRQIKRPMLSDLRESGSLEQDADIVMFLYRDDYYNEETERPNITDIIIAKHRNGEVGDIQLFFQKDITRFETLKNNPN